jgi:predicted O-methyltransferase YrrM
MKPEETLKFIADRYKLDLNQPNPIQIPASRWHDLGHLLNALGCKKAVEVGVYRASFTQTLASRARNMEIIGVDAWTTYDGYKDYEPNHLETEAYRDAHIRAERWPNIKLIKGWSKDIAPTIEDNSLDYLFIDANHEYAWVVEDLHLWAKKVKPGGIVMGHDYFVMKKLNFGVIQAVNGWVETHHIKHLFTWRDNCPSWMFIQGDTL